MKTIGPEFNLVFFALVLAIGFIRFSINEIGMPGIGETYHVTEKSSAGSTVELIVKGKPWKAVGENGETFKAGERVVVSKYDGDLVIIEKMSA